MSKIRVRHCLVSAVATAGFATALTAQVMPAYKEPDKQFTINSNVDMVLLDVGVKDAKGGFASDLKQDNFKVYEDGRPQTITSFTSYDTPVTVGLVVDNSGSMRYKRADTVTAALTFSKESNPQDEMFVVNFNDTVSLGLPAGTDFTDDNNMLRTALLNNPTAGQTALYDALYTALSHLDKGRRDKKTLVLISDGGDNRSQHTLNEVIEMAQKSTATIYAIGIYDPEDKDANPGVLRRLAALTGGDAFFPKISTQIVDDCRKIAKDIRNRYTMGYTVTNTTYDNKVRKLRVEANAADRGKLIVRTRTSYIARASAPKSGAPMPVSKAPVARPSAAVPAAVAPPVPPASPAVVVPPPTPRTDEPPPPAATESAPASTSPAPAPAIPEPPANNNEPKTPQL